MRIRTIKPEFYRSDDIAALRDPWDRLLFVGLWSYVDDNAVGRDTVPLIVADIFPLDDPRDTLARVSEGLVRLSERGLIERYEVDGRAYLFVNGLSTHQKIDHPSKPRYPTPVTSGNTSPARPTRESVANPRETLAPVVVVVPGIREQVSGSREVLRTTASDFNEFWDAYPRKDDKTRAKTAWMKAVKTVDSCVILAGARRYADDPNRDSAFTKQPATWLNAGSWANEQLPERFSSRAGPKPSTTDQRVNQNLQFARRIEEEENRPQFRQIGTA